MKEFGKNLLIGLIPALATGLLSYVATNASVENSIVTEMSEYFASVDAGMSYKQAIATVYEENQTLSSQVQQLQSDNSQLGEQVDSAPDIAFFSPSLVQDGLEISSGINNGVAKIDGRVYVASEAVDPFLDGTVTFDEGQNILASGTTDSVAVTKENLLDTNVLYDGIQYSVVPNENVEALSVAGVEYREGILLDKVVYNDCYILLNLRNDYSTLVIDIGRLDGSNKGDAELEVYLDEELSTTHSLSSDTPIQTIEIPLNYAGSMKLRLTADDYLKYCIVNPVLIK
ncbi:NPCBM/NEW2 domain-containing protein [uncultured Subdoligranulum sp.]|uniref:NPCBM/NEW2 domain-containing protein n=1 Tax=uncultured Subdoligranulum sp. TaxID=512298 RepID=UPI0025F2187E|nr:NPCBM/NEW2 domain-containing protein [uncultured Subdoligranulum sp.]